MPSVLTAWAIAVNPATRPASSIGTTIFDDGETPSAFSASRYCSRIVLVPATRAASLIFSSAEANPSACRICDCR